MEKVVTGIQMGENILIEFGKRMTRIFFNVTHYKYLRSKGYRMLTSVKEFIHPTF